MRNKNTNKVHIIISHIINYVTEIKSNRYLFSLLFTYNSFRYNFLALKLMQLEL